MNYIIQKGFVALFCPLIMYNNILIIVFNWVIIITVLFCLGHASILKMCCHRFRSLPSVVIVSVVYHTQRLAMGDQRFVASRLLL